MNTYKKHKAGSNEIEKTELKNELDILGEKLKEYEMLINMTDDDGLTEALIYEYKAVKLRYSHIIKLAREKNITIDFVERCI